MELVLLFVLFSLLFVGCVEVSSVSDSDYNRGNWFLKWAIVLVLAIIFALEIVG